MHKNKKNIVLVGCGRISKSHIISIIKNHRKCNLAALCDSSKIKLDNAQILIKEELLKNKLEIIKPKVFEKYEELLMSIQRERLISIWLY